MRLVKDSDVIVTDNENVISAYLEAGYVEEVEVKKPQPSPKKKPAKE